MDVHRITMPPRRTTPRRAMLYLDAVPDSPDTILTTPKQAHTTDTYLVLAPG